MLLTKLYVRFYKSFNFDYERKANSKAQAVPWESFEEKWFPHVSVAVDPAMTAIVGANESGKSHLLGALKILITGEGIERGDFCRYSEYFSVARDQMRMPEFGGEFRIMSSLAAEALSEALDQSVKIDETIKLFRPGASPAYVILGQDAPIVASAKVLQTLEDLMPVVFELDTGLALPDSVPIAFLAGRRRPLFEKRWLRTQVLSIFDRTFGSVEEVKERAPDVYTAMKTDVSLEEREIAQRDLGRKLLIDVCQIDPKAFDDLAEAMAASQEGRVSALIQKMNSEIASNLNLPRWWTQDREFKLMLSPREHEVCFTIRDRTGTDYSFAERSRGLQYFLSYYVQLRAHQRVADRREVLLMDEPDAYLSSLGQQDLLRVLEDFARPADGGREDQVVYVTHSPFLINRNFGHRIRVIDKGTNDEGTRVVKDPTRNHYEPLRSSLGTFVAETAFIGGSNLFVEGFADQVLLAGMTARLLRGDGSPLRVLDLNEVTLVPAGSAGAIPYMVYLARGRDQVKPPCVVLLDGDSAGQAAHAALRKGGARDKRILADADIVRMDTWAASASPKVAIGIVVEELEDLIPVALAVEAARGYATHLLGLSSDEVQTLKEATVTKRISIGVNHLWNAIEEAFTEAFGEDAHIEKLGFAKEVVALLERDDSMVPKAQQAALKTLEANFAALIANLSNRLRIARGREDDSRRENRLKRVIDGFLSDFPSGARRDRAMMLIVDIDAALDDSNAGDRARQHVARIRREYALEEQPTSQVSDYEGFCAELRKTPYQQRLEDQDAAADA